MSATAPVPRRHTARQPADAELRARALALAEGVDRIRLSPPTAEAAEARRAAAALRTLTDLITSAGLPLDTLRQIADATEDLTASVADPVDGRVHRSLPDQVASGEGAFFEWSPNTGRANPVAPPIELRVDPETATVIGTVTYGRAYEGPPGCLHGGFVANAFDEVLGVTGALTGEIAMTGTLTVRYRRPTPLGRPLRIEGWLVDRSGRKARAAGRILLEDGTVTAEAEGLFVTIPASRFGQITGDGG